MGLLIIRIGLGILFTLHGYPKVFGGPEKWVEVGLSMQQLGVDFAPMFFGFMAGVIELFGGIFMVFGIFYTPTMILLALLMGLTALQNVAAGQGFTEFSHPLQMTLVFLGLLFIGPGQYSVDNRINRRRRY